MPCCRRRRQSRAGQHGVRMASMYYNTKRIETNRRSFVHTAGNSCVSKLRVGCDVRGSLVCWSSWPAGNGCCRATSQMLAGTTIWGPSLTKHRRRRTRRNSTDCMSVLPTVTYIKSKLATYVLTSPLWHQSENDYFDFLIIGNTELVPSTTAAALSSPSYIVQFSESSFPPKNVHCRKLHNCSTLLVVWRQPMPWFNPPNNAGFASIIVLCTTISIIIHYTLWWKGLEST